MNKQTCSESEGDEQLPVFPSGLTRESPLSEALAAGELTDLLLGKLVWDKMFGDNGHTFLVNINGSSLSLLSCKQIII